MTNRERAGAYRNFWQLDADDNGSLATQFDEAERRGVERAIAALRDCEHYILAAAHLHRTLLSPGVANVEPQGAETAPLAAGWTTQERTSMTHECTLCDDGALYWWEAQHQGSCRTHAIEMGVFGPTGKWVSGGNRVPASGGGDAIEVCLAPGSCICVECIAGREAQREYGANSERLRIRKALLRYINGEVDSVGGRFEMLYTHDICKAIDRATRKQRAK